MTCPMIPAGQWPDGAVIHTWDSNGLGNWLRPSYGAWHLWESGIPMPPGHDWRVPVMRPTCKESLPVAPAIEWARPTNRRQRAVELLLAHGYHWQDGEWVAPTTAIDLGKLRAFAESVIDRGHRGDCESRHRADNRCDCGMGQTKREAKDLLALIDNNVQSCSEHSGSLAPVAHKKLQGLQDEGFIVNGVAIFNPITGQRGLVDYLGYVGWQASEQPSVAPVGVEGLMQLAREWCMSWGEWAHDADPGCAKENAAEAVLRAALTQALAQQPSKGEGE